MEVVFKGRKKPGGIAWHYWSLLRQIGVYSGHFIRHLNYETDHNARDEAEYGKEEHLFKFIHTIIEMMPFPHNTLVVDNIYISDEAISGLISPLNTLDNFFGSITWECEFGK
jgi:hypothetical protein